MSLLVQINIAYIDVGFVITTMIVEMEVMKKIVEQLLVAMAWIFLVLQTIVSLPNGDAMEILIAQIILTKWGVKIYQMEKIVTVQNTNSTVETGLLASTKVGFVTETRIVQMELTNLWKGVTTFPAGLISSSVEIDPVYQVCDSYQGSFWTGKPGKNRTFFEICQNLGMAVNLFLYQEFFKFLVEKVFQSVRISLSKILILQP